MSLIKVKLSFSGGMELLFNNIKQKHIEISSSINPPNATTMKDLVCKFNFTILIKISDNLLKERPELFMSGDTVRPGILVLINETDWELEGELEYEIKDGDDIVFISTLHGG
ncbi:11175_t:CDS:2 [Funneliformis geosporum]|uniref:Ubiquitin-related modifier 1 n=1 Tax=Funneliformis geosporum TaxID=1117311 RepID=A0A9W4WW49_9GLOM|nr:11175_t:CDS:2 [Funneliformis geosporum]CAI2168036.1 2184_t:CDS:2 [Funneliformis geosporum]